MSCPFIQHDNIYFVPVIRHRLNFAVLVNRAVQELDLNERDAIAVELPQSVCRYVNDALKELETPRDKRRVSVIVANIAGVEQREVFPVTPSDGIVEALRIVKEKEKEGSHIPLFYIDQEVTPGHLADRHCVRDPSWPDDSLALEQDPKSYLEIVQDHLCYPPARLEPVDSWREMYMADRLRQLHLLHRRVLVVCDLVHVNPIRELLRQPSLLTDIQNTSLPKVEYEIRKPPLHILMRYLDDFPRLVELWEHYRSNGMTTKFNKITAILDVVYQVHKNSPDLNFSIRHYQAFTQLLYNARETQRKFSLTIADIYKITHCCFNKMFAERVYRHLMGYFREITIERIAHFAETDEDIHVISTTDNAQDRRYVARHCNQIPTVRYKIRRKEGDRLGPSSGNSLLWPDSYDFIDRMRRKAIDLAAREVAHSRTSLFRGSLEAGINLRRTARSFLSATPTIYVKQRPRIQKQRDLKLNDEPVVWLFEVKDFIEEYAKFDRTWFGNWEKKEIGVSIRNWHYSLPRRYVGEGTLKVRYGKLIGTVNYSEETYSNTDLQERLGKDFDLRIPKEESMTYDWKRGYIFSEFSAQARSGSPWWELLLLGAVRYAQENVICVVPPQFVLPESVVTFASSLGKGFRYVPLAVFTQEELRKFRNRYSVPYENTATLPYGEEREALIKLYSPVMKQFWE